MSLPCGQYNSTYPPPPTPGGLFQPPICSSPVPAFAQHSTALTGDGYIGLHTGSARSRFQSATTFMDNWNYVSQPLNAPSAQNRRYYAEFYHHISPYSGYTTARLGLVLRNGAALQQTVAYGIIPATPVVDGPAATVIGWQRIGGVFTAGSAMPQPYLTVGDFSESSVGNLSQYHNGPGQNLVTLNSNGYTYYNKAANYTYGFEFSYSYFDNVLLSPLPEAGPSYAFCSFAPPTTLGTHALPPQTGATYLWASPTDLTFRSTLPMPVVQPTVTTQYLLTVTVNGVAYPSLNSATITITPPAAAATSLQVPCGNPALLRVTCAPPGVTFTWTPTTGPAVQGNPATGQPTTTSPVVYTLSATGPNGQGLPVGTPRTTTVQMLPPAVDVGSAQQNVACGGAATLRATCNLPGAVYTWTNGTTGAVAAVGNPATVRPTAGVTIYIPLGDERRRAGPGRGAAHRGAGHAQQGGALLPVAQVLQRRQFSGPTGRGKLRNRNPGESDAG